MKRLLRLNSIGAFAVSIFLTCGCLFSEALAAPTCRELFELSDTPPQDFRELVAYFEKLLELGKFGLADEAAVQQIAHSPFIHELGVLLGRDLTQDLVVEVGREAANVKDVHHVFKNYAWQLAQKSTSIIELSKALQWMLKNRLPVTHLVEILDKADVLLRQPPSSDVKSKLPAELSSAKHDLLSIGKILHERLPEVQEKPFLSGADFHRPNRPVRDQCTTGSCWLQGSLRGFESDVELATGGRVQLSVEFSTVHVIINRVLNALRTSDPYPTMWPFDGGNFNLSVNLAKEFGVVPEGAWPRQKTLIENSNAVTGEVLSLTAKLREQWGLLQEEHRGQVPQIEARIFFENARKAALSVLEPYVGTLPAQFKWNGSWFTPQQFAQRFLLQQKQAHAFWFPKNVKDSADHYKASQTVIDRNGYSRVVKNKAMEIDSADPSVLEKISQLIDQGRTVYLAFRTSHTFDLNGEMIYAGYAHSKANTRIGHGHHAVAVVDYARGPDGKIIGLKLQNSHGVESGDQGYLYMSKHVFEKTVLNVEWLE